MRMLLDSHTLLWYLLADERLPPPVGELIEDSSTRVAVSVASLWELTLKALGGRLRLPSAPEHFLLDSVAEAGFEVVAVQERHVAALPELRAIHSDPFDRMIVAQALVEDMDLVTGDEAMRRYPVRTIW